MENTSHIGQLSSIYKVCAGYIDLFTCTLHSLYLYLSVFSGKSRIFLRQFHFRYSLFVARFGDTTRFYTFLVNSTCRHLSNREATTFAFSSVLRCKNGIKIRKSNSLALKDSKRNEMRIYKTKKKTNWFMFYRST